MCEFKSGIIFKNMVELTPLWHESHSRLLESLNIEDSTLNASKMFVRAELTPPDGNVEADVKEWNYRADQDILPDWYTEDSEKYETEFRNSVAEWIKGKFKFICGYVWLPIKEDKNGTYYLMHGKYKNMEFGETNNYDESYIRKELNESELAENLKKEFGNRIVPIETNLLSLDGLNYYGTISGDTLAIPTIDLYRECRKKITNLGEWWWLATPDSTQSGCGAGILRCVSSDGDVSYEWCYFGKAVRPFFILRS